MNVEGSVIQTEPEQIPYQTILLDPIISNNTSIYISWEPMLSYYESGGSPVINYLVLYN